VSFIPKSIIIAAGIAALSLSVIGCQGNPSGNTGYVPASAGAGLAISQPIGDKHKKQPEITSNCSHRLHLVVAGLVDCKFREKGYKGGMFTVANDTKGLVLVTPSSGTQGTTFTIVGLVLGSGKLVWSDSNGNKYPIRVKVTL
jgi:hypothetical protein